MDPTYRGLLLHGRRLGPGNHILCWAALVRRMLGYERIANDWTEIAVQLLELASQ